MSNRAMDKLENYEPELGQMIFGQPTQEYGVCGQIENVLRVIRDAMPKNKYGNTPFDNSGERFKNDVFECNAYDWSECKCEGSWDDDWNDDKCKCGWRPQLYNFKWRDFEVSWYKYLGRGMSMNRPIGKNELNEMLTECITSLTKTI